MCIGYLRSKVFFKVLGLLVISSFVGCAVVESTVVESMSEKNRSELFLSKTAEQLCGAYLHPLAQKETLESLSKQLADRGYTACLAKGKVRRTSADTGVVWRLEPPLIKLKHIQDFVDMTCDNSNCPGNQMQQRELNSQLYDLKLWESLAVEVASSNFADLENYFYFAKSLYELKHYESSKRFMLKAKEISSRACNTCQRPSSEIVALLAEVEADLAEIALERDGVLVWKNALTTKSKEDFEFFIANYPNSIYLEEAKERVEWSSVLNLATEQALINFKVKYPNTSLNAEVISQAAFFLSKINTTRELDEFSRNWPELNDQINAKKAEIEISEMLETAKTEGTSIKLYQFGLKRQAAGDLDGASRAYNAIVEKLPEGDFVVESLEKLLEVKAAREQIARDKKAKRDEEIRRLQRMTDEIIKRNKEEEAAKAAEEAAKTRKLEADRKKWQERRDREQSQREAERNKTMEYYEICEREWKALQKRCKASDVDCLNGATENYGICLKKYNLR